MGMLFLNNRRIVQNNLQLANNSPKVFPKIYKKLSYRRETARQLRIQ